MTNLINLNIVLQSEATRFQRTPLSSQCFTTSWGDHWFKLRLAFQRFTPPLTRDPDHWEEPDKFKPERFLDHEGRLVRHERFLPFGVGTDPHMKLQVWSFWNQGSDIALGSPLPEMNSSWFSLGSFRQTFWNKILWILWISYQNTFESLTIRIQANLFLLTEKNTFFSYILFESPTIIPLNLWPTCLWIYHHIYAFHEEHFSCSPSLLVLEWLNRHRTLLPASFSHQSKLIHFIYPASLSQLFQAILRSSYTKKLVGS